MADRAVALLAESGSDTARKGYAAYVHMVDPVLGKKWIDEVDRLLARGDGG